MRFLVYVIATVVLTGCATFDEIETREANERYDKMMGSFLGVTESALIDSWGPDRVYEDEDRKFLIYTSSRIVPVPSPMPIGTRTPFPVVFGGSASVFCKNTFEIKNKTVVSVEYKGNACRA